MHSDFHIGCYFNCGDETWLCTDVGQRVVIAIKLPKHVKDYSWFNGPTYAVAEIVFDEDSILACTLNGQ